jgi:predicted transposase/invertase (TIGR01784 family)
MKDKSIERNFKFNLRRLEVFIINMFVEKEKRNDLLKVIGMNVKLDNLEEDLNNWETEILNKGKQEGIKEGKKETKEEIAKKLKGKLPVEEISPITRLSEEKINKL